MLKLIADMDPGTDDALALLLLARAIHEGKVELLAVNTVHGNTAVEQATRNALALLELLKLDVPVASGAARNLSGALRTADEIHGSDGLGETRLRTSRRPREGSAVEQLLSLSREHPGELAVLATGPLTNIALALSADPALASRLARLVVMGGAVHLPGNITPVAEANFFNDPEAAAIVLKSGVPLTLVGLDVTRRVFLTPDELPPAPDVHDYVGRVVEQVLRYGFEAHERLGGPSRFVLHDPLAAAALLDPAVVTTRRLTARVETSLAISRGMLVCDVREGKSPRDSQGMEIAMEVDRERFLEDFRALLSWRPNEA